MGRKRLDPMEVKKSITVTLRTKHLEELVKQAEKYGLSVNQYITKIVEKSLKK